MGGRKILCSLLILSLVFAFGGFGQTQAQSQYSLNLERVTWNHSTLRVLVTPPNNASWWNPSYLNATVRAISQWNHGILDFASKYTDYAYLASLKMTPTVAPTNDSIFDIFISWTETPAHGVDEMGYNIIVYNAQTRILLDSSIDLATKTLQSYVVSEVDMQNIALDELGHSLGLGHSNRTGDVMYINYSLSTLNQIRALSTLDLYGLSIVFQWMSNSSPPFSPQQPSVFLPAGMTYQYLPTSTTDLPPASISIPVSQIISTYFGNLVDNVASFIKRPEILILIVAIGAALTALILASRRTRPEAGKASKSALLRDGLP